MTPEDIPSELKAILDKAVNGPVMTCLAEILTVHESMLKRPACDSPEELARLFHEAYERLAPSYGYETRKASAVPWDDVPAVNKALMVAVANEVGPAYEDMLRDRLNKELYNVTIARIREISATMVRPVRGEQD